MINVFLTTSVIAACVMLTCEAFSASVSGGSITSSSNNVKLPVPTKNDVLKDFDYKIQNCLPWNRDGYQTWTWRNHKINYVEMGDASKPALLFIHGFGASAYHFRYNIPVLARDYHVFAIDLLGFGLSDKPLVSYAAELWRDQAADFVTEMIQKPTTLAGNSLGGFTALYASSTDKIKDKVNGCILLNAAGRFRNPDGSPETTETNVFVAKTKEVIQRLVIGASFIYTKQPARINQVLRQVYPIDDSKVDAALVDSIHYPSLHPNASEVFYRVLTQNGSGPQVYTDDLLEKLECPLLLCWGELDPWIRPAAANRIQALYPGSQRISINAGHCPQDEAPDAVNAAILKFMKEINQV